MRDRADAQDLNPHSRIAGLCVARLLPGLGPASMTRLLCTMDGAADPTAARLDFRSPGQAMLAWAALRDEWARLRSDAARWPDDLQCAIARYQPHLERLHDDARLRRTDLDQLALDPPQASSDEAGAPQRDEDGLILLTSHSAQSREWNAVSILNVVDGRIPADMATGHAAEIEEDRRLLYVAMTRASDSLNLVVPQRFYATQQRCLRHAPSLRVALALESLTIELS